jgi:hypothetical protein
MSVESGFAKVSERLLRGDGGVEQGRMLHAVGLKTASKFFAFATNGELVVKLAAARVKALIADGVGRPCEPRRGRPLREWVRLAPADEEACAAYVIEACTFVAGTQRSRAQPRKRPAA